MREKEGIGIFRKIYIGCTQRKPIPYPHPSPEMTCACAKYQQRMRKGLLNIRALRSRSLRDGSLPDKSRFATFVRSCSALQASKRPLKYHFEICMLDYPFGCWNQVNPTIFEICLLYENIDNKYSYEKYINAKFGINVYLY